MVFAPETLAEEAVDLQLTLEDSMVRQNYLSRYFAELQNKHGSAARAMHVAISSYEQFRDQLVSFTQRDGVAVDAQEYAQRSLDRLYKGLQRFRELVSKGDPDLWYDAGVLNKSLWDTQGVYRIAPRILKEVFDCDLESRTN